MVQQGGLIHRAGVVVQAPGDGQIHGEIFLRNAEGGEIAGDGVQLLQTLVEQLVPPLISGQGIQHLPVAAGDGDEPHDLVGLLRRQSHVLRQAGPDLAGSDLVQLVHGAHDVAGLLRQAQHGVKSVEDLPVVDPDLEPGQAQGGEGLIDDGGDLRLVGDVQLAVADDVDVRLIELPEAAPLGPLAPVYLADLIPAEGEGQVVVVQGHILGQGHRQVKPQGQIGVALLEAVDLLLGFAAALGQQHLAGLDGRGVQGSEAVSAVGGAQDLHHPLHLLLRGRQQLHEAGESPGGHSCHGEIFPFCCVFRFWYEKMRSRPVFGTRAHGYASWCHPNSARKGALAAPVTGSGPWMFPSPLGDCLRFSCRGALSAGVAPLWCRWG